MPKRRNAGQVCPGGARRRIPAPFFILCKTPVFGTPHAGKMRGLVFLKPADITRTARARAAADHTNGEFAMVGSVVQCTLLWPVPPFGNNERRNRKCISKSETRKLKSVMRSSNSRIGIITGFTMKQGRSGHAAALLSKCAGGNAQNAAGRQKASSFPMTMKTSGTASPAHGMSIFSTPPGIRGSF